MKNPFSCHFQLRCTPRTSAGLSKVYLSINSISPHGYNHHRTACPLCRHARRHRLAHRFCPVPITGGIKYDAGFLVRAESGTCRECGFVQYTYHATQQFSFFMCLNYHTLPSNSASYQHGLLITSSHLFIAPGSYRFSPMRVQLLQAGLHIMTTTNQKLTGENGSISAEQTIEST